MGVVKGNDLSVAGNDLSVADGGLETSLSFNGGFELPCFAAFPLLETERGRVALRAYFKPFLELARKRDLPCVLDTVTWRANPDWGERLGYDHDSLAAANRAAVDFARDLAETGARVVINGVLGPRGDGYIVRERMDADEAADYHRWQIGVLQEAGVERITALTLTYTDEAIGIVRAAVAASIPVVPGFTVETDGKLPDGTSITDAVQEIDRETNGAADFFIINCAHPKHIAAGIGGDASALRRIGGLRANASVRSHAELDEADQLDEGDPIDLARDTAALREKLPSIRLLGGCCGTDHRHVTEIVDAWIDVQPASAFAG